MPGMTESQSQQETVKSSQDRGGDRCQPPRTPEHATALIVTSLPGKNAIDAGWVDAGARVPLGLLLPGW